MDEHRLTRRLLNYWEMVRKDRTCPEIYNFNTAAVEDVWPYCFQVSVDSRKGIRYRYEYMGKPIVDLYGLDLTGEAVDHGTKDFPGAVIHKKLAEVLEKQTPLSDEGHFPSKKGKLIKYRACLLPFGNPENGVTHVVVGLSCRSF